MKRFDELNRAYGDLKAQLDSNRIDRNAFVHKVHELRLKDDQGTWWQIDPDTGGWLRWDGSAWMESVPPASENPTPAGDRGQAICPHCRTPLGPGTRFCTNCGAAAETASTSPKPLQETGTVTTEAICANCGALTPSGVAHCTACGEPFRSAGLRVSMSSGPSSAGATDQDMRRERPSEKRQNRWDWFAIFGGLMMASIWFFYSNIKTQPDYASCGAMVGLPILFKVFRSRFDRGLLKIPGLQTLRQRTPPVTRIGVSLAMPLLLSTVLYIKGIKNFPLMFWTIVLSVAISYALLRQPLKSHS